MLFKETPLQYKARKVKNSNEYNARLTFNLFSIIFDFLLKIRKVNLRNQAIQEAARKAQVAKSETDS